MEVTGQDIQTRRQMRTTKKVMEAAGRHLQEDDESAPFAMQFTTVPSANSSSPGLKALSAALVGAAMAAQQVLGV